MTSYVSLYNNSVQTNWSVNKIRNGRIGDDGLPVNVAVVRCPSII
jgi:hypothetical protein